MSIKRKNSYGQLLMIIIITFLTQSIILYRVSIVASNFGVSIELDAFNFANTMSVLIFSFITSGVTTVLIPNLNKVEDEESINSFLTTIYILATFLLLIFLFFNKEIITIASSNNDSYFVELSRKLLVILVISQYINSYLGIANAVLQVNNQFDKSKIAILITNVISIIIIILNPSMNIYEYALIISMTTILNVVLHYVLVIKNTNYRFKIGFNYREKKLKKLLKNFIPIIFSTGLYQISLMVDTLIASRLGVGQISILNYSNNVVGMVSTLIVGNIVTFLFPKIVKDLHDNKSKESILKYIIIMNSILLFIILMFFLVGKDGLKILYYRGDFTISAIDIVYLCSLIYIIAIPVSASRSIIYKYFYANNDTYTPFSNSLFISLLNIVISIILSKFIGLYGVALGTSISSLLSFIFISIKLKKKFAIKINTLEFFVENSKIILSCIIAFISIKYIQNIIIFNNLIINITITFILTLVIYILFLGIFKSKILKYKL